jgi:hypothetical protein
MHGYRFPFIATIARPFLKFNINNAVIPGLFILTFLICSARFQYTKELVALGHCHPPLRLPVRGPATFLSMALLYFTRTNTDIIKTAGQRTGGLPSTGTFGGHHRPQHDAPPARRPGEAQSHPAGSNANNAPRNGA